MSLVVTCIIITMKLTHKTRDICHVCPPGSVTVLQNIRTYVWCPLPCCRFQAVLHNYVKYSRLNIVKVSHVFAENNKKNMVEKKCRVSYVQDKQRQLGFCVNECLLSVKVSQENDNGPRPT